MTPYSVQPRNRTFIKHYGFLSFAKNMDKNINKILSNKYSQNVLDHAKQSDTVVLKTSSKGVIQKTAEATDDLFKIKLLIKLRDSQKLHDRIVQKQIKKYLKKNIYLQN